MANPIGVLSSEDYSNYRNIRAVAVLFVVLGGVSVLGGIGLAFDEKIRRQEEIHPAVAIGIAIAGAAAIVGGIATLRGSRRWSPLVYGMAALYVFVFPFGTILSIVLFKGLSRYLDSVERVRADEV